MRTAIEREQRDAGNRSLAALGQTVGNRGKRGRVYHLVPNVFFKTKNLSKKISVKTFVKNFFQKTRYFSLPSINLAGQKRCGKARKFKKLLFSCKLDFLKQFFVQKVKLLVIMNVLFWKKNQVRGNRVTFLPILTVHSICYFLTAYWHLRGWGGKPSP